MLMGQKRPGKIFIPSRGDIETTVIISSIMSKN
jgi:hypothetical protein